MMPLNGWFESLFRQSYGHYHHLDNLYRITVTDGHGYFPFVIITIRFFPYSWLHEFITGFVSRITRRVSLVEQELPTLPQHTSSRPLFSGVRVAQILVFCVVFCRSLFAHLSLYLSPLHIVCRQFVNLRLLITTFVTSNCDLSFTV